MIRAVAYDVDGTLYSLWPMRYLMAWEIFTALARRPRRIWREMRICRIYRSLLHGLRGMPAPDPPVEDPQLHAAAKELGVDADEIRAIVHEWVARRPLRFLRRLAYPHILQAIGALHRAGVPQGVYSDYPPRSKLEAMGIADFMKAVVWSGERQVGQFKPSPRGFLRTAELLGVEPAEVLYVGDRDNVDGAGARAAGMQFLPVRRATPRRIGEMLGIKIS